jgi:hypothetical protein
MYKTAFRTKVKDIGISYFVIRMFVFNDNADLIDWFGDWLVDRSIDID